MTPEHLTLLTRTAVLVDHAGDEFAGAFYDRLFELHPSARTLFPDDLAVQRGTLTDEFLLLVALAADLPAFLERCRDLGRRHQAHGVHADDYPALGEALVGAVAQVVGDAWSDEMACAWRCFYALLADAMLEGAADGLFTPKDERFTAKVEGCSPTATPGPPARA